MPSSLLLLPPLPPSAGEMISCSRDLTCVYYLTKDWTESMGGAFVDLEAPAEGSEDLVADGEGNGALGTAENGSSGRGAGNAGALAAAQHPQQRAKGSVYVPRWNSAVFFRVPRYHTVTPLRTDRPR